MKIRQAGKRVGSRHIREVVHAPPADIRNVHTEQQLVIAVHVGKKLRPIEVILRPPRVGLRAASREKPGDDNLGIFIQAESGRVIVADKKLQLVHPLRRENVPVTDVDLVLQESRVRRRFRKHIAPGAHVIVALMLERVSDPEVISVVEVVKDAPRAKKVPHRLRYIFVDGHVVWAGGHHRGLVIVLVPFQGQEKRGLLALADRPSQ